MYIYIMIAVFVTAISVSLILKNINIISCVNIFAMFFLVILTLGIGMDVAQNDNIHYFGNAVYIDSLSQIQLIIITTVSLITAVYSR